MTNNNDINTNNINVGNKTNENVVVNNNVENKEEIKMKKIRIVVAPEIVATLSKESAVATYKNKLGFTVIPQLESTSEDLKADGIQRNDISVDDGQKTLSYGTFMRFQAWYENRVKNVNVLDALTKQTIVCYSFQAAGLKGMLEAAGYTVEFDIKNGVAYTGANCFRTRYDRVTAKTNKNTFKAPKGIHFVGTGQYVWANGTLQNWYLEGKHMSRILLPNDTTDFNLDANYFETRGAIAVGNEMKAIVYLLVMANTRNEAIARVNTWAAQVWGKGAKLSLDNKGIPVGYLAGGTCCWELKHKSTDEKTAKNAMTVLKEAYRTNDNKCLYAKISTEHTVTPHPQSDDINDKIKAAVATLQQQIDALKIENKNLKAAIEVVSSKLAAIVGVPAEPTADKVEEPAVKEEPEISTPDIKQEDKPEGNDDPKDPTPENDEPNNKENTEEDPYAEFEGMDFDEAEIVVESAFKGKDISDIKEEKQDNIKEEQKDNGPDLEEIELVPDMPTGTVKSKRTVKKENPAQVSLFDEPAKKDIPVLTETKAEEKPAITVDEETIKKITDFADVPRVSFPNQYVYPGDYEKAVAEREARIQAALSAIKVLGVDLESIIKMTIKLRPNNTCTFRDIKIENDKVFVKTETNGQWQHLTIVSNGRRNVLKLGA